MRKGFKGQFYLALSGEELPGIMCVPYDLRAGRTLGVPEYVDVQSSSLSSAGR
jgi:hypothetical protein